MNKVSHMLRVGAAVASLALASNSLVASSHQDAPLVVLDPAANTTDVYAFVVDQGVNQVKSLVVALGVYPFEEPGIGPNKFNFDDNVLYEIHVALGPDRAAGRATLSYQFQFTSRTKNPNTTLYNYTGVITNVDDAAQNFVQTYTVTKVDHRARTRRVLGTGVVPPNNQGTATPFYNRDDDGEQPARDGALTLADLDRYTRQVITPLSSGYVSFAGQRDDGFYADIRAIFDLLTLHDPGKDNQGGFNIHLMALEIPVSQIGGDHQIVGVYATTSRQRVRVLRDDDNKDKDRDEDRDKDKERDKERDKGPWVQVARQGNPLFNEGLVAIVDKDLYGRTSPETDGVLFRKYAENPELGALINAFLLGGGAPQIATGRTDIAAIYIPDLIKVDLSTTGTHLTATGGDDPAHGFSRLSIFGGDVLHSTVQDPFGNGGFIPAGWPNGRRFGDDVVDIAVDAILSDLKVVPPVINTFPPGDGVTHNDMNYNRVFPYESTPQNGRIHGHHGAAAN